MLGGVSLFLASVASAGYLDGTIGRTQHDAAMPFGRKAVTRPSTEDDTAKDSLLARSESRRRRTVSRLERVPVEYQELSVEPGLQFESEVELKIERLENIALDDRAQGDMHLFGQEIQLGWSYRRDTFSAFGELALAAEQVTFPDDKRKHSEESLQRGEMWLLFKQMFGGHYSGQFGRQNFFEPRLWWWDDDLDAVRIYYARESWHYYVGVARELGRVDTHEEFIDPEDDRVQRLFGHIDWKASETFDLSGFLLAQRDNSGTPAVDSVIASNREDASDANLLWAGLRATSAYDLMKRGHLSLRADIAVVGGDETLVELEDDAPGYIRATGSQSRNARGWAVDLSAAWTLPLTTDPVLKLVYAYGSGDNDQNDRVDRAFRQTGLQDQDEEFRDYGVVFRPELSNLHIATLVFRLPVYTGNHLTLGYHHFRQVSAAPFLRQTGIDAEPIGDNKDIGEEISLVLQLRKWEDIEIDIIAGSFEAGRAYAAGAGERVNRLFFKLIYEF